MQKVLRKVNRRTIERIREVFDMYCPKCGQRINGTEKFCPKCGNDLRKNDSVIEHSRAEIVSSGKNKKRVFVALGAAAGLLVLAMVFMKVINNENGNRSFFSIFGKTDMEKMVGTWSEIDGTRSFRFYEPEGSSGDYGDFEYIKGSSTYYGSYEWHKSSKRIVMTVTDNWGSLESMSYDYEIIDRNHINFRQTENPDKEIEMEKSN